MTILAWIIVGLVAGVIANLLYPGPSRGGVLAAIVLGLPLSIFVWFVLDFQNSEAHPMWHGLGLLFVLSFVVLIAVTLVTPAESPETLKRFYERCRPPGFWGPVRASMNIFGFEVPSTRKLLVNSVLGIVACFCA